MVGVNLVAIFGRLERQRPLADLFEQELTDVFDRWQPLIIVFQCVERVGVSGDYFGHTRRFNHFGIVLAQVLE